MQQLESFRNFISQVDGRWKNIDDLLKHNFEKVTFRENKDIKTTSKRYEWIFNVKYNNKLFDVCIEYYAFTLGRKAEVNINCKTNHKENDGFPLRRRSTIEYRDFMLNGVRKINALAKDIYETVESHKEEIRIHKSQYESALKRLTDAIKQEDLEDILSEISDLSSARFEISPEVIVTQEYPFYIIQFYLKKGSDSYLEEYAEFYRIISTSIKRIRSGYDVTVKWNQDALRLIISPN